MSTTNKKTITLTLTTQEATEILSARVSNKVTSKILSAMRGGQDTPVVKRQRKTTVTAANAAAGN